MDYDDVSRYMDRFCVSITGARSGDMITGTNSISGTAVMKIVHGNIPPLKTDLDSIRQYPELWVIFLNKLATIAYFKSMTVAERDQWMEQNQIEGDVDIAEVGVKTDDEPVQVEVMDAGDGKFTELLDEETLNEIVSGGPWTVMDLRNKFPYKIGSKGLLGRSTLIFYMHFWRISVSYDVVSETKSLTYSLVDGKFYKGCKADKSQDIIYLKNALLRGEEEKQDIAFLVSKSKVIDYWELLKTRVDDDVISIVKSETSCFTPAGYKSLLQKIIRYTPLTVKLAKKNYHADQVLCAVFTCLMTCVGSFVPDIQRFVTGQESAFKRLAVSVLEDSYIDDDSELLQLMMMAFLSQRTKWKPTEKQFMMALDVCVESYKSNGTYKHGIEKGFEMKPYYLSGKNTAMINVSAMLDTLRSFQTDLAMTRYIAGYRKQEKHVVTRPVFMPLEHCIDHHWAPEVVYLLPPEQVEKYIVGGTKPYLDVMKNIFMQVTGFNSRTDGVGLTGRHVEADDEYVGAVNKAQTLLLKAKQNRVKMLDNDMKKESYKVDVKLSQSWIAGLLGQIEIKGKTPALATLNPYDPYEIIAIRKPSRGIKDGSLTEERSEQVKDDVRKVLKLGGYMLNKASPPLPSLENVRLRMDDDGKYFFLKDGKRHTWEELALAELKINILVKKPKLTIDNCITYVGNGMYNHAFSKLRQLLKSQNIRVIRRLLSYMSSHRSEIEIARLSKDGGGVTNAVVFEDVAVCQIMLVLCLLFPVAIKRVQGTVSRFKIVTAPLFWQIADKIRDMNMKSVDNDVEWVLAKDTSDRIPHGYQIDVLDEMIAKEKKGHFIWIPVGMGKTFIVLSYISHLIHCGKMSKYAIYTLPKSAIKSIIVEIQHFNLPINLMVPIQSWKKHPEVEHIHSYNKPLEGYINLVEHDHLRKMDEVLLEIASDSVVIIDEVHKALNDTKRTGLCLELSRLSVNFIALTGTPIVDSNTYKLIWWLEQLVDFEVNERNFWVGANAMVARKVRTEIKISTKNIMAEMTTKQEKEYGKLVPPAMGGDCTHPSAKDIRKAFDLCYKICDGKMIDTVMEFLERDIGVMLVAKNAKHQAELLLMLVKRGMDESDIFSLGPHDSVFMTDDSVNAGMSPDYKVVIVPLQKAEGYTLTRLGARVSCVYPSNCASRLQSEARINRLSQKRSKIYYRTIHTGILTYVMQKHASAASLMAVLSALAKEVEMKE